MYVHELSAFDPDYTLDARGIWQPELAEPWAASVTAPEHLRESQLARGAQPFHRAHVIARDQQPVGFACVGFAPFKYMPDDVDFVMAEYFVIHAVRGSGLSRRALELLLARYHGRWYLRALAGNTRAARFWAKTLPLTRARDLQASDEGGATSWRFVA
jgi:predicted acetyltransferase